MSTVAHPLRLSLALAFGLLLSGCASQAPLPTPRLLVNPAGQRLNADIERMEEIDAYVRRSLENIERDPSFLIRLEAADSVRLLWDGLAVNAAADTASISLQRGAVDAVAPYQIYAHLHLMAQRGQLEEWIPGAGEATGFERERVILGRIADVWFYGRAVYDAAPYAPLDQLLWSREQGYLEAYILSARGDDFADTRAAWEGSRKEEMDAFREWFRRSFSQEPPAPVEERARGEG